MTTQSNYNYPFTNKNGEKFDRGDVVMIKNRNYHGQTRWKIHTIRDGMAYIRTAPVYTCGGYNTLGLDVHIDDLQFVEHGDAL